MSKPYEVLKRQAESLQRQGRRGEAIASYRQLLALQPDLPDCWYELGYLLKADAQYDAALQAYAEALARGMERPEEAQLNRAVIYSDHLRRDGEAERELRAALAVNPDYAPALLNLGNLQEERGMRQEALATYERLLDGTGGGASDHQREALARIAHLRPPTAPDDVLLVQLRAAADDTTLGPETRANLLFALGRALDRLDLYDQAFAAFVEANAHARRAGPVYPRVRSRRLADALIRTFAQPTAGGGSAPGSAAPVFICGMFRSGSTLLEQILAAHPHVTVGGEIDFLPRLVRGALAPFPQSMSSLDDARLETVAREYRAHLEQLFPQKDGHGGLITDKRPDNFLLIGLIKRLFPSARIIHTVRHPLDTCLSIFMQHLGQQAASYASDLGNTGHFYGQYRRVMAHWKQLYPDSILDFHYDVFVREPRPELERLLAFLGLEWDERCLDFSRQDNTVKSASYWQVREPLYAEASGRWRNYVRHLGPLVDAFEHAGIPAAELE